MQRTADAAADQRAARVASRKQHHCKVRPEVALAHIGMADRAAAARQRERVADRAMPVDLADPRMVTAVLRRMVARAVISAAVAVVARRRHGARAVLVARGMMARYITDLMRLQRRTARAAAAVDVPIQAEHKTKAATVRVDAC